MVAFLSKPAESEGFEQIVDFLNANPIKYALTINPTIYTSCIEQLWATVKAETISGEVQLQALVDGKKIIITESIVRRDLQLEDAEATDQKFNFSKYIFESMVKNLRMCLGLKWGLEWMGLGAEMGAEMEPERAQMGVGLEAEMGGFGEVDFGAEMGSEVCAFGD
ncbi:hypothetical protein Tco_1209304 [Tanacetum coccineum]